MAPIRYPTGGGSTASLDSQNNAGKLAGTKTVNPNSPATFASLSRYNANLMYADMAASNARNQVLISAALRRAREEAERRRREEEARLREMERQQQQQEQARRDAAMLPASLPALGRYDEEGRRMSFDDPRPGVYAPIPPERDQPQPYTPLSQTPFQRLIGQGWAAAELASDEAVKRIMADTKYENVSRVQQLSSPTSEQYIQALESDYEYRLAQTAIDVWGRPREMQYYNPNTGKMEYSGMDWSYVTEGAEGGFGRGISYLGLRPGEVPNFRPAPPPEDASWEQIQQYKTSLEQAIRAPMYTPESPMQTLWSMGEDGIKQFQKMLLKGQFYDSNDSVKLGVIGPKEIAFMTELMTYANINGFAWEDQMKLELRAAKEAADIASSAGGGGGGGGGGTTIYKQIQYAQTSIAQARSLLINILKEALGREPTDSEIAKFTAILNKAENESPTRTVTKTTTSGDTTKAVSRTTPSGVDAEYLAREFARGIGGGEPYKANATVNYLSGLLESLGRASV